MSIIILQCLLNALKQIAKFVSWHAGARMYISPIISLSIMWHRESYCFSDAKKLSLLSFPNVCYRTLSYSDMYVVMPFHSPNNCARNTVLKHCPKKANFRPESVHIKRRRSWNTNSSQIQLDRIEWSFGKFNEAVSTTGVI